MADKTSNSVQAPQEVWRAIYEADSGRLISVGTIYPATLPGSQGYIESVTPWDMDDVMWDETLRNFVPRPPKIYVDRIQDLLTDPAYLDFQLALAKLLGEDQTQILVDIGDLLGRERFRSTSEGKVLGRSNA